ncbi:AAA family ATPase [Rhodococcus kroppenstedtii]|uniref:AAA family ATPase n=1 Tax=Rhodococcoides kroppenstedtii TaxID=293050 RepID=UPI0029540D53|nr:AAA family ATPase [Rhodococcus kroppenstedtii]MDV7198598.1 AAA family ATPase [Rhodococcus kroppenstedtii]
MDESVSENYQRLIWQTFSAVFDENTPESATKLEIRERLIGKIKMALNSVLPELTLTRVGGFGSGHSFEFSKGVSKGFPYINLSAGEKAVFDLILDAVVKAEFYQDALWCIDEPEVHVGAAAQALLLRALVDIVPDNSQLLLASHSIGFMTEAVEISRRDPNQVAFLDFGGHDFDRAVVIEPSIPTRSFWKGTLEVALGNIATLVAPSKVVLCEGGADGFDAKCYRAVFKNTHPDVDFVSVGNSHDASSDKIGLTSALQTIASGTDVIKVRDRDIATDAEVAEWEKGGVRALN